MYLSLKKHDGQLLTHAHSKKLGWSCHLFCSQTALVLGLNNSDPETLGEIEISVLPIKMFGKQPKIYLWRTANPKTAPNAPGSMPNLLPYL